MRAKRSLGQNFLTGTHYPRRIVDSVPLQPGETVVEIGPGHGALTALLLDRGARVVAVEIDSELIPALRQTFGARPNFLLIEADALTMDLGQLIAPAAKARVVANLPYYISTPILQRLIEQRASALDMTLMLQREVVDRITAPPGGKEYGALSVLVQFYCETEKLFDVPPGAFRPSPKVWSSVMRLTVRPQPAAAVRCEATFIELTKALFAQRRKTILNNLRAAQTRLRLEDGARLSDLLARIPLDPQRRAETLSIAELALLADALPDLM
ncbi:MAG: 16S rRNA (adenine(1518)-N(6)/adenine(1519)-N(6))-dimethyltransferase RsmA [Blastocatellia bacterium]|nr:16S rRNA (adenine(1518)-N(6)/adenine(1519)-N(6))-dimethyltransferase RsmA [Blastocatellia bacterium]